VSSAKLRKAAPKKPFFAQYGDLAAACIQRRYRKILKRGDTLKQKALTECINNVRDLKANKSRRSFDATPVLETVKEEAAQIQLMRGELQRLDDKVSALTMVVTEAIQMMKVQQQQPQSAWDMPSIGGVSQQRIPL